MTVDILYFEGCPNSDVALREVRAALRSEQIYADVRMVEVHDAADAIERQFLGSPTIQVNGRDVEPEARLRSDYGFMCRTYQTPSGIGGVPTSETIVRALREGRWSARWPDVS